MLHPFPTNSRIPYPKAETSRNCGCTENFFDVNLSAWHPYITPISSESKLFLGIADGRSSWIALRSSREH
ncbi:unnamed protein product [Nippostrongylus brasiliensis]|uniref:Uncharacterized protein n=1 Tax=Nippostrongylus brasiliensis TaxID=27835 RepID=A0A0N4YEA0_NIPBR|nr:unnamed protein product [Nippostrongylus brasiliensis]